MREKAWIAVVVMPVLAVWVLFSDEPFVSILPLALFVMSVVLLVWDRRRNQG